MRAIVVDRFMEPAELTVREAPAPALGADGVRIRVFAAGCNFFDLLQCRGQYQVKPPFPFIPGAEVAGEVLACGAEVRGFAPGARVLASTGLGGFAEQVVARAAEVYALPARMGFDEGAALPIVYATAELALGARAALKKGETLLVHAAAGGVGSAAVQIGRALGARVLGTAGGAEKLDVVRRAGAHLAIDYRAEDFAQRVREATGGRGADVIFDPVGGEVFERSLSCIAWNGRLLVIGFAGGRIPSIAANRILLKNIAVVGLNYGGHQARQPEAIPDTLRRVLARYERGEIAPLICARYPLAGAADALEALGARRTWGKLLIEPQR